METPTLLVDDEPTTRQILEKTLLERGHRVVSCATAEDARGILERGLVGLAVVDWMLPGMSGLELCRQIRLRPWGEWTYVVMITGRDQVEDLKVAVAAGVDDFLTKPIRSELLDSRLTIAESRLQQQLERRRREKYNRTLISSLHEDILVIDRDYRIIDVNHASLRTTLPGRDHVIGRHCHEVTHGYSEPCSEHGEACHLLEVFTTGQPSSCIHQHVKEDGTRVWVDLLFSPMKNENGEVTHVIQAARDVSEVTEAKEQLRRASQMEAIGQFAAGLAHDFSNLIMVIQGTAQLLLRRGIPDPHVRENLELILRSCRGAGHLTGDLLSFARKRVLEPQVLDLAELVADTAPMLSRLLPDDIDVRHTPAVSTGHVRADPGLLRHMLMNLCVNSRDAMPDGGTIVIETGSRAIDTEYLREHPWAREGVYSYVAVTDTGVGMDEATVVNIFDPFFTTKEPGRGTGLGLASVMGTVKQHRGMVDVESEAGRGSTFTIYLPEIRNGEKVPGPTFEAPVVGGCETILVVDDHEELRVMLNVFLESLGYRILTASDGVDALAILHDGVAPVDLVVTDVSMPRMGGLKLLSLCGDLQPMPGFLFCSGENVEPPNLSACPTAVFIQKPFDLDDLARKVRLALSRAQ